MGRFYSSNSLQQFRATRERENYTLTSSTGTNISLYLTSLHTHIHTRTHISQQLTSFQTDSGLSRISHTNTRTHACLHKNTHSSEGESALFCGFVLVWCKAQVSLALVCLVNTHRHTHAHAHLGAHTHCTQRAEARGKPAHADMQTITHKNTQDGKHTTQKNSHTV